MHNQKFHNDRLSWLMYFIKTLLEIKLSKQPDKKNKTNTIILLSEIITFNYCICIFNIRASDLKGFYIIGKQQYLSVIHNFSKYSKLVPKLIFHIVKHCYENVDFVMHLYALAISFFILCMVLNWYGLFV